MGGDEPSWRPTDVRTRATRLRSSRLTNLSLNGCCADLGRHAAAPGERVLVRLNPLLVLPATVKWVAGRQAGLEFRNPIHGALLGQFAARCGRERGTLH